LDRLARPHQRPSLPPLPKGRTLTAPEQAAIVDRLYLTAMSAERTRKDTIAAKLATPLRPPKRIPADQEVTLVRRMYYEPVAQARANGQLLTQKYMSTPGRRVLSTDQLAASTQRLFYESLSNRQKKRDELWDKYIKATDPRSVRLPPTTIAASAARLHSREAPPSPTL